MADRPWVMRTYSGHSTATASNELYRTNLAKGQTGLSVAFDLPTQTGYDPDTPQAAGEVGKVGVPVVHIGHVEQLFDQIPVDELTTSMTINAPASWMLALYIANAENRGIDPSVLGGTTQNDIIKEYLSRGTYIFPPEASRRLTVDTICYTVNHVPRWNPINVCSYHLQEAGATPVQELAFTMATAVAVLDGVRDSGQIPADELAKVVERISFFVNAGIRFIEEVCKIRAFGIMWDTICKDRYRVEDPKARRFRYAVQVNSLGLTEQQAENNVQRIVLEMLGVTLSKDARTRSLQLPAWNEALGLPRPWDQQWALRMQQVLAFETDLLKYNDIFRGSHVIEAKTDTLVEAAWAEFNEIEKLGGAFEAIEELKSRLVRSQAARARRIEVGEQKVVGVNCFEETAVSPLGGEGAILKVDPAVEVAAKEELAAWRAARDQAAVDAALAELKRVATTNENVMAANIALAHAGGTTGEWAGTLREVFGEYRAPTGVAGTIGGRGEEMGPTLAKVKALAGGPPRLLVAKPGLDGHSNGAEQVAVAARDAGFEVIYQGIRLTPQQIADAARDEDVDVIGLSILSGGHLELVPEVIRLVREAGVDAPVIVGGIIPEEDAAKLIEGGVAAVYTPKDYALAQMMGEVVDIVAKYRAGAGIATMANPQPGIFAVGNRTHHHLEFDCQGQPEEVLAAVQRIREAATTVAGVNVVVGFSARQWESMSIDVPDDLIAFATIEGPDGFKIPATQHDLWLWLHASGPDSVFNVARIAAVELADLATVAHEQACFTYQASQDLTGFEDGTENPPLDEAIVSATIPGDGGSIVLLQKWVHDLDGFEALELSDREQVIGRTLAGSVELDEDNMIPGSHVSRVVLEDDNGEELEVFRRSTTFGGVQEHGLMFLAFSADRARLERMLQRMAGADDGVRDRLTEFSTPARSAWYYAPPLDRLRALVS